MGRRAHCPACSPSPEEPVIVDLPHECPNAAPAYQPENYGAPAPAAGKAPAGPAERDAEGRPVGKPFRPSVAPRPAAPPEKKPD